MDICNWFTTMPLISPIPEPSSPLVNSKWERFQVRSMFISLVVSAKSLTTCCFDTACCCHGSMDICNRLTNMPLISPIPNPSSPLVNSKWERFQVRSKLITLVVRAKSLFEPCISHSSTMQTDRQKTKESAPRVQVKPFNHSNPCIMDKKKGSQSRTSIDGHLVGERRQMSLLYQWGLVCNRNKANQKNQHQGSN